MMTSQAQNACGARIGGRKERSGDQWRMGHRALQSGEHGDPGMGADIGVAHAGNAAGDDRNIQQNNMVWVGGDGRHALQVVPR